MADPLQAVITLFSSEWNSSNTDGVTPVFAKITSYKRIDFRMKSTWILFHRMGAIDRSPAGIGVSTGKNIQRNFNLDIRVQGVNLEEHFYNVISEAERILQANKVFNSDYTILEYDGQARDLSDKSHNIWRYMFPIQLKNYNE